VQDDCIAVRLGLPQLKILWQRELEGHIEVTVIYRRDKATCPRCSKVFTEPDEVFGSRRRSSYRFREYLGR